jgi:RNA-directed DNA polymerase
VNVQEKSDCAVVPLNRLNKEGQPSAEVGEGRAQTGRTSFDHTCLRRSAGNACPRGLDGVRQAASERKQERFTALRHHLSLSLLRDSFYALKRQASPGIDGVTSQEYETGLEGRLCDLHSRVHRGAYRRKWVSTRT